MGAEVGNKSGGVTSINIVPLVDVVLVLLIIFLVTATVQSSKVVPVQVPKASSGVGAPTKAIMLSLDMAGILRLDGNLVDLNSAERMMRDAVRADTTVQVLISADESLAYARVVEVLDAVRIAGVGKYALKIRAASQAASP